MQLIAYSPEEWSENAVKNRARIAIDEIVDEIVHEKIENGDHIQGTKEEILLSSNKKTAKEITDELDNEELS
jgi:hypothetical protein